MKILMVLHQLDPATPGGVESHVLDTGRELARRGHDVHLLAGSAGTEPSHAASLVDLPLTVLVRRPVAPGLSRFFSTVVDADLDRRFDAEVARLAPDLVHVHHFMYLSMGMLGVLERRGIPCVCTVHDHALFCHRLFLWTGHATACSGPGAGFRCGPCNRGAGVGGVLSAPVYALRNALAARWARRMPLVLSPTRYLADFCVRHGLPADRVRVLELGVPAASRVARREGARPVRFGFAGTLRPHKGAHVLLEAFELLDRGLAELVLYGDLSLEPDYGVRIEKLANAGGVRLERPFERTELDRILAGLDCVVIPSLAAENAPLLARECLARGVPVLASRIGGLPEVAAEGRGVRYFPAGDVAALASLLEGYAAEPGRLDRLAADASPPATLEAHVTELEGIYARMGPGSVIRG
ncbi:MAG: glycosyltransferase [Candidatus Wallbacteria bacterium]|nr:glycosyltransferase [Candidatus Wallbacteria bacterium]